MVRATAIWRSTAAATSGRASSAAMFHRMNGSSLNTSTAVRPRAQGSFTVCQDGGDCQPKQRRQRPRERAGGRDQPGQADGEGCMRQRQHRRQRPAQALPGGRAVQRGRQPQRQQGGHRGGERRARERQPGGRQRLRIGPQRAPGGSVCGLPQRQRQRDHQRQHVQRPRPRHAPGPARGARPGSARVAAQTVTKPCRQAAARHQP